MRPPIALGPHLALVFDVVAPVKKTPFLAPSRTASPPKADHTSGSSVISETKSGVRVAQDGARLPARDHYQNQIARHYADLGHVKFAEILEAGHGCAACHLTHEANRVPTDGELELGRYVAVTNTARAVRTATEVFAMGVIGAAGVIEGRLAGTAARIRVQGYSATEAERITLQQLGEELASNPVARRAYSQVQKQGTEVIFDFKHRPAGQLGSASWRHNRVKIYVSAHRTNKGVVSTLVHESSHITRFSRGAVNNQLDEVRAFSREFLYQYGRRPTLEERKQIWELVRRVYAHLGG